MPPVGLREGDPPVRLDSKERITLPAVIYYRRTILEPDETTGHPHWGTSVAYYETADDGGPLRQVQLFANGTILAYDEEHDRDNHGWLDPNRLAPGPGIVLSTKAKFDMAWAQSAQALNRQGN